MNMEITPQNPFITNSPVIKEDFIGRKEIIDNIISFIEKKKGIIFFLYGQRRTGKTSILKKILDTVQSPQSARMVYFNVQDKARTPLSQLLLEIASSINDELNLNLDVEGKNFNRSNAPGYFKKWVIPSITGKISPNQKLLLLVDEFDVLISSETIDVDTTGYIDAGAYAAKNFIPFMISLSEEIQEKRYPIKFLFAIGSIYKDIEQKRLGRLTSFGAEIEIPYFIKTETEHLLKQYSARSIPFEKEAIESIYTLTSGHPFFTQSLAKASFDAAEKINKKKITSGLVKQQLMPCIKRHSSTVFWIWNGFPAEDRLILYLMAVVKEEKQPVSIKTIKKKAADLNVSSLVKNLPHTLEKLKAAKYIRESPAAEGEYEFYVEFIRKWIVNNVSDKDIL
jgi:uncharacterized protein involved in tolerance to divalent cations